MWSFQTNDLTHGGPISALALNQPDHQSLLFRGNKEGRGQNLFLSPYIRQRQRKVFQEQMTTKAKE